VRAGKATTSPAEGVWFASSIGRRIVAAAAVAGATLTGVAVVIDELLPDLPSGIVVGLAPFLLAVGVAWGAIRLLRWAFGASAEETAMAWFAAGTASYGMLTVVGVFFRGAGMALRWPC